MSRKTLMARVMRLLDDAVSMRRAHGWLTVIWLAAAPFIVFFLADSIPFLVFVSVYAVVTGHWASWQASMVEVNQDEVKIEKDREDSDD